MLKRLKKKKEEEEEGEEEEEEGEGCGGGRRRMGEEERKIRRGKPNNIGKRIKWQYRPSLSGKSSAIVNIRRTVGTTSM